MRTLIGIGLVMGLCGCTDVKLNGIGRYRNGLFTKNFAELSVKTTGTNGVTTEVRVKGYNSTAEGLVEAAAKGVAAGLKP